MTLTVCPVTEMVWSAGYNANADAYDSPKVVRDWYNAGFVHVT
jgi:hypothetical protein